MFSIRMDRCISPLYGLFNAQERGSLFIVIICQEFQTVLCGFCRLFGTDQHFSAGNRFHRHGGSIHRLYQPD